MSRAEVFGECCDPSRTPVTLRSSREAFCKSVFGSFPKSLPNWESNSIVPTGEVPDGENQGFHVGQLPFWTTSDAACTRVAGIRTRLRGLRGCIRFATIQTACRVGASECPTDAGSTDKAVSKT